MRKTLTPAKVRAMRRLYWIACVNSTCLARMYGVPNGTVWDAVNYLTWKEVKDTFRPDQIVRSPRKTRK